MAATKDWLPTTREGVLVMADDWIAVYAVKQADWNIPDAALTELAAIKDTAATLVAAKNETTRISVATTRCKEAFDALSAFMRDFKRHHFLSSPHGIGGLH
jgi:hypothetical protein